MPSSLGSLLLFVVLRSGEFVFLLCKVCVNVYVDVCVDVCLAVCVDVCVDVCVEIPDDFAM